MLVAKALRIQAWKANVPRWCSLLALALVAQQVAPLDRPEVGVLVARQERSIHCSPLVADRGRPGTRGPRSGVGSVPMQSRKARRRNVGIVGQRAGDQVELLPLRLHQFVDVVLLRAGPATASRRRVGQRDADPADVHLAHVAGHDRRVAGALVGAGPGPCSSTAAMFGLVALELGFARHVPAGAVGIERGDQHLLLGVPVERRTPRGVHSMRTTSGSWRAGRRPLRDPAQQQLVFRRVRLRAAGRRRAAPRAVALSRSRLARERRGRRAGRAPP